MNKTGANIRLNTGFIMDDLSNKLQSLITLRTMHSFIYINL